MIILDGLNNGDWDEFITRHSLDGGFLQSWQWGEFQKSLGREIWRLAVVEDSEPKMLALFIKYPIKFGTSYLYSPRGPVSSTLEAVKLGQYLNELAGEAAKLAKKEKAVFWRIEPGWTSDLVTPFLFNESGFFKAPADLQPRHTLILDLSLPQEELLKQMKPKTRYNIGLAQKHEVTVRQGGSEHDLKIFYDLLKQTTARQEFQTHVYEYFQKMWFKLAPSGELKLFLAEYKGKIIGGILVSFWNDVAAYLHGGMIDQYKEVMAPYLLQWSAILEAQKAGMKKYDFWGVAPAETEKQTAKEKRWVGITRFKTGFAPESPIIEYVGAYEKVSRLIWYRIYRRLKK